MAAKKKTKKKQTKSKRTAGHKMTPMKKTAKKKLAMKRKTAKKELAKKAAQKKATVKTKAVGKKTIVVKTATALKKQVRAKSQSVDTVAFSPEDPERVPANREICRDYPTSKVRIRRVSTSCSRRETRSKLT